MIRKIRRAQKLKGSVIVPGDKSISHRALLFGAIANGTTKIKNLSSSADVTSTMRCLKQLNIEIKNDKGAVEISGKGLYGFSKSHEPLDCGNSGTTMRLLTGILAAQPFSSILIGDESLSKRPMKRIIEPLSKMGAKMISQVGGFAPLQIQGTELNPIYYETPVASAQVKSCVLLAGLYAKGITTVVEPFLSRDHTERILMDFGVHVQKNELTTSINGHQRLTPCDFTVPGDFSSAAFFIGGALVTPDSELKIKNVCLNTTRTGFLDVIKQMGAKIEISRSETQSSEPLGDVTVFSSSLNGINIPPDVVPQMIDEIPMLAVISTQAKGVIQLSGAKELRVKESDRLQAIVRNLSAMGIQIEEREDGFIIQGPQKLKATTIDSYGDHRIAMAFAIAGLIAEGETQLINSDCVEISMPNFFEKLQGVLIE